MPARRTRGSAKLPPGRSIRPKDLQKIIALTKRTGVRVVDWTILGQPTPDAVTGSLHVRPGQAPRVLAGLLKLKDLRPELRVFPRGIPRPDLFEIRFRF